MQKSTTIIGVLEMLEDGFSYNDIELTHSNECGLFLI